MESDQILATQAKAGRREAFDALVERHGPGLFAFLKRMTRRTEDAQDLFQETFLRAFRSLTTLKDPALFRPWVVRIATNAVRRQFQRNQSRGEEQCPSLFREPELRDPGPTLAALEIEERRQAVRAALLKLPPRQQAVLSLRLDLGLPFQEIGQALEIREENARAHHYQALRSLKRRLGHLTAPQPGDPS